LFEELLAKVIKVNVGAIVLADGVDQARFNPDDSS